MIRTVLNQIKTKQGKCDFLLRKQKIVDTHYDCVQVQINKRVVVVNLQMECERGIEGLSEKVTVRHLARTLRNSPLKL